MTAQKNPFKYNGKEEITDLGVNWYDYGQRNYDAALGRFFNVDRFSEKYHNLNPYQYGLNNPVLFIDINGDSTVYYDYDGNVLHTSHDELENAVVFIEDDNLEFFNTEVSNFSGDGKGNNDDTNSALRTMGTSYMTDGMEAFFDENNSDINSAGVPNEHATYLYEDKGEVSIGGENFQGDSETVAWGEPEGKNPVGKQHNHPNSGPGTGYKEEPSDRDKSFQNNRNGYYNVVVGPNNIYFYNNVRKIRKGGQPAMDVKVSRKDKFKK